MTTIIDTIKSNSAMTTNNMDARHTVLNALLFRAWSAMEQAGSIRPNEVNAAVRIQRAEATMERYLTAFQWVAREFDLSTSQLEPIVDNFIEGRQRGSMPQTEQLSKKQLKKLGITGKQLKKFSKMQVPAGFSKKLAELQKLGFTGQELLELAFKSLQAQVERAKARVRSAFQQAESFRREALSEQYWNQDYVVPDEVELTAYNAIVRAVSTSKKTVARGIINDWSPEFIQELEANHLELVSIMNECEERYVQITDQMEQREREGRQVEPETVTKAELDDGIRPAMH